jgi:hypothetical protein
MTKSITYGCVIAKTVAGALVGEELRVSCGHANDAVALASAFSVLSGMFFAGYRGTVDVRVVQTRETTKVETRTVLRVIPVLFDVDGYHLLVSRLPGPNEQPTTFTL